MLSSLLTSTSSSFTLSGAVLATLASLGLGLLISYIYMAQGAHTRSFAVTLALMPMLVSIVIMMVNDNLGAGVAVLGAFSLVRFRSVPGSSKDILMIFFAMAIGLASGMGYVLYAAAMTLVGGGALMVLSRSSFGEGPTSEKELRITIPESLDYNGVFDDLFQKYARKASLERVKTTNMGSLFELMYHITLKDPAAEKALMDEIRCRNGNLTVVCGRLQAAKDEL